MNPTPAACHPSAQPHTLRVSAEQACNSAPSCTPEPTRRVCFTRACLAPCPRLWLDGPGVCVLDVVRTCGRITLEHIGELLGSARSVDPETVSRQRVKQIERIALTKLRRSVARFGLTVEDVFVHPAGGADELGEDLDTQGDEAEDITRTLAVLVTRGAA